MAFMFWNQWRSRKKYQDRLNSVEIGDRIVTIGGIYGKLTQLDRETKLARLEVAPGIEIEIGLGAISRQIDDMEQGEGEA
jgi:preprotein translocase subunit YajC